MGRISLWTAIVGLVGPILLALNGTLLGIFVRLPEGYYILCAALMVLLELAALVCGIVGRRTASGKAGIAIAVVAVVLVATVVTFLLFVVKEDDRKATTTATIQVPPTMQRAPASTAPGVQKPAAKNAGKH